MVKGWLLSSCERLAVVERTVPRWCVSRQAQREVRVVERRINRKRMCVVAVMEETRRNRRCTIRQKRQAGR